MKFKTLILLSGIISTLTYSQPLISETTTNSKKMRKASEVKFMRHQIIQVIYSISPLNNILKFNHCSGQGKISDFEDGSTTNSGEHTYSIKFEDCDLYISDIDESEITSVLKFKIK